MAVETFSRITCDRCKRELEQMAGEAGPTISTGMGGTATQSVEAAKNRPRLADPDFEVKVSGVVVANWKDLCVSCKKQTKARLEWFSTPPKRPGGKVEGEEPNGSDTSSDD